VTGDEARADDLARRLRDHFGEEEVDIVVTRARNSGVEVQN
jgi:hypothetical protein